MKNFKLSWKMMKTKINFLTMAFTVVMFQSCLKEHGPIPILRPIDNKLLLSKVTGTIGSNDFNFTFQFLNNFNTYIWSNPNPISGRVDSGKFQLNFNYGNTSNVPFSHKPIAHETFLDLGHYDFSYNGLLPDKVADHSVPQWDLGYWKFYYDSFNKTVNKIGLAFSTTTDPVRFEYYDRDYEGKIKSFVYGISPDTPYMKVLYKYDFTGNISTFEIYVAKNQFPTFNLPVSDRDKFTNFQANHQRALDFSTRINENKKNQNPLYGNDAEVDTSIYNYYLTATVTTDGKINPYSQQGNIFFYQTNRWYSFYDVNYFYLNLLKSNPLKIEYKVPLYGPDIATQTFSYTYNEKNYPITVHEEFNDPDFAILGTYTRDSQIEYIKNE